MSDPAWSELEDLRIETAKGVKNEGWRMGTLPGPSAVQLAFDRIAQLEAENARLREENKYLSEMPTVDRRVQDHIATNRALTTLLAEAEGALEFYGDETRYSQRFEQIQTMLWEDGGKLARAALAKLREGRG